MTDTTNSGAAATQATSGEAAADWGPSFVKAFDSWVTKFGQQIGRELTPTEQRIAYIARVDSRAYNATTPAPAAPTANSVAGASDFDSAWAAADESKQIEHKGVARYWFEAGRAAAQAPAAKAEPVARISNIRDVSGDIFIDVEWLRPSMCEIGTKLYTAPVAQADDVRDAALVELQRIRDKILHDQGVSLDDLDAVAAALRTTSAAPADQEGK